MLYNVFLYLMVSIVVENLILLFFYGKKKKHMLQKLHQIGFEHKLYLIKRFIFLFKVKAYFLNNFAYFQRFWPCLNR